MAINTTNEEYDATARAIIRMVSTPPCGLHCPDYERGVSTTRSWIHDKCRRVATMRLGGECENNTPDKEL